MPEGNERMVRRRRHQQNGVLDDIYIEGHYRTDDNEETVSQHENNGHSNGSCGGGSNGHHSEGSAELISLGLRLNHSGT